MARLRPLFEKSLAKTFIQLRTSRNNILLSFIDTSRTMCIKNYCVRYNMIFVNNTAIIHSITCRGAPCASAMKLKSLQPPFDREVPRNEAEGVPRATRGFETKVTNKRRQENLLPFIISYKIIPRCFQLRPRLHLQQPQLLHPRKSQRFPRLQALHLRALLRPRARPWQPL